MPSRDERGSASLYRGSGSGVQGRSPWSGGQGGEADDISASLDYICEVNLKPEFIIMGVYLSVVP